MRAEPLIQSVGIWSSPAGKDIAYRNMYNRESVPSSVLTEPDSHKKLRVSSAKPGLLPLALWSMAVLMIILGTTLFAHNQRNLRHIVKLFYDPKPSQAAAVAPIQSADATPTQTTATTSSLLSIPQIGSRPLIRLESARERCMSLEKAEQEQPVYLDSVAFSQCTILLTEAGEDPSASVFVQLQTDPAGMVSSFRLKLNTSGNRSQTIADEGLAALHSYGGFYQGIEELMPMLGKRIKRWEDFQTVLGPYVIEMNREVLDPTRFNVFGRLNKTETTVTSQWRSEQGHALRQ